MKLVVIGGGMAGCFATLFLLRSGHDVTLVDDEPYEGVATSRFNSGILSSESSYTPIDGGHEVRVSRREREKNREWFKLAAEVDPERYDEIVRRIVPRSVTLYEEVLRGRGEKVDLQREGLMLFSDAEQAHAYRRTFGGRIASERELSEMGYAWEGEGVVHRELTAHTGKLLDMVKKRVSAEGARFLKTRMRLVASKEERLKRASARLADGTSLAADGYVVATGSWSRRTCAPLGYDPHVLPAKGFTVFCSAGGERLVEYPAMFPDMTLAQHDRGTIRLTGFVDLCGFDKRFPHRDLDWLLRTAASRVLRPERIALRETGVGFRPLTPDQLPVVGRVPNCSNVFIATGGSRKGITLAPLMGHLLARAVDEAPSKEEGEMLTLMSPARFSR